MSHSTGIFTEKHVLVRLSIDQVGPVDWNATY